MINKSNIIDLVDSLIKMYGTRDPYKLARHLDIEVINTNFTTQKGVYKIVWKNRFIFLNESLEENLKRIVLYHEIGHDQLHRNVAYNIGAFQEFNLFNFRANQMEYEANLFTAEISLPTDEILECINLGYSAEAIAKVMHSDINLIGLKLELLISQGYKFTNHDFKHNFLKS